MSKNQKYTQKDKERQRLWRKTNISRYMWLNAKHRAKRQGIEFLITEKDIKVPKKCPALGISLIIAEGTRRTDNSPSLDRIHLDKGYIKGNVVVVSHKANCIKYTATPDEIFKVANYYKRYW